METSPQPHSRMQLALCSASQARMGGGRVADALPTHDRFITKPRTATCRKETCRKETITNTLPTHYRFSTKPHTRPRAAHTATSPKEISCHCDSSDFE